MSVLPLHGPSRPGGATPPEGAPHPAEGDGARGPPGGSPDAHATAPLAEDAVGAFRDQLDHAAGYPAIFALAKKLVDLRYRRSRAGIMLGLSRMGLSPDGYLGGYFVVGSNAIVLNRDVLDYVRATQPAYLNAYAFHVLLHEYLHTLGWFSEEEVRPRAHEISRWALGPGHPATIIAAAMDPTTTASAGDGPDFLRSLVYPAFGWAPSREPAIEIVKGFDLDASPYIG